jgi:hypothetical protein
MHCRRKTHGSNIPSAGKEAIRLRVRHLIAVGAASEAVARPSISTREHRSMPKTPLSQSSEATVAAGLILSVGDRIRE